MRTIKFRGKVDGLWWHVAPEDHANWEEFWLHVDRETVGEYIGLKDAALKEIYEGDILGMENCTAKVVFWETPPEFGLDHSHDDEWCDDWNLADDHGRMEIIGNIYEHPHLLQEAANAQT